MLGLLGALVVKNVLFDHLEFAVLARDVAVLEGDEDGVSILALKPLLSLQGRVGSRCVWVQVILEQVGLKREDRVTSCEESSTPAHYKTRLDSAAWDSTNRLEV